jgi:arginine N-succinyltransferase
VFLIRDARAADLDSLHAVAKYLDSVNLPDDRDRLRTLIAASQESFAARSQVANRKFLFVLTDVASDRVIGTSMIFAQHGSRRAPHVYFDVLSEERYSETLDRHFVHRILRIGYNYNGVTEIGGLVLLPEFRAHPDRLGMLLSAVRFMYMARHRSLFRDEVISELMPPLEPDGTSRLWEALGRKFTGLSYQQADRLSHENKEFIRALFPEVPIYVTLLPAEVQSVIGQVGPETKGVEAMLRRIGFEYAHRIDPFDGGPHFQCHLDDVTLVRLTRSLRVIDPDLDPGLGAGAQTRFLIAAEGDSQAAPHSRFQAIAAMATVHQESVSLSSAERSLLSVEIGAEVACLPLDASRPTPSLR